MHGNSVIIIIVGPPYWYEAPFFILSLISHGDGFRECRVLEWLIPIGTIIISWILATVGSRVPIYFFFIRIITIIKSRASNSSIFLSCSAGTTGTWLFYWLRNRGLSSPSEGRPLALFVISTAGSSWLFCERVEIATHRNLSLVGNPTYWY